MVGDALTRGCRVFSSHLLVLVASFGLRALEFVLALNIHQLLRPISGYYLAIQLTLKLSSAQFVFCHIYEKAITDLTYMKSLNFTGFDS